MTIANILVIGLISCLLVNGYAAWCCRIQVFTATHVAATSVNVATELTTARVHCSDHAAPGPALPDEARTTV